MLQSKCKVPTLMFALAPYCGSALSLQKDPLLFMPVMSWERRSTALCPHVYTSLWGLPYRKGPFSHHPSVSEAVTLHVNGPNGLTTGTKRSPSFPLLPPALLLYFCILSLPPIPASAYVSLSFSLNPVFGILALTSINHLSCHCDVLRPHWGNLRCDLASSWFSCRVILCMSVPLSVAHNSDAASFPASSELFILFSCERMELSRCITGFTFSGQAHCFPWPLHFKVCWNGPFFFSCL